MNSLELNSTQELELHRIIRLYRREALKCQKASAYLAGCVLAGAAIEAMLLSMVNVYPDETLATNKFPTKKGRCKALLDWNLGELLTVAKAAGWLPAGLSLDDEWNRNKALVGDYAEVVRLMRNLLHPARFLEDHERGRITNKHASLALDTTQAVIDHLLERVSVSLRARMTAENEASPPDAPV